MIHHKDLGNTPFAWFRVLQSMMIKGDITLGGYKRGKIYGTLSCGSGKRMKTENRVFFANEQEAVAAGYRPCGNCMPQQYQLRKQKAG
ncbi:metal-binding protein [Mucilaginibacter corticis]|uniref:Metal-binding protein n=1 Tax=Mucilaginibacter corticis TaxID=2597670 RepID=A0A556MK35_9SPHI|nr:Ada metal-binding domain-containing protein [Mucilaginibacter corticis]TSJ40274.1 metal-binding protein [Mucilaginibacter corticis]